MAPESEPAHLGPRRSLLIVDDEGDIREALRDLVEMSVEGAVVHTAANAIEARSILEIHRVDLILSDYRMPGQNGLELFESLAKSIDAYRVLLTAYPEVEVARRAAGEAKVVAFLTKPVEPQDLLELLTDILDGAWTPQRQNEHHNAILGQLRIQTGTDS